MKVNREVRKFLKYIKYCMLVHFKEVLLHFLGRFKDNFEHPSFLHSTGYFEGLRNMRHGVELR